MDIPTRFRISPTPLVSVESMAATRCNGCTLSWCNSFASELAPANISPSAGEHSMSAESATGLACDGRTCSSIDRICDASSAEKNERSGSLQRPRTRHPSREPCSQFALVFSNNCIEKMSRFKSGCASPASLHPRQKDHSQWPFGKPVKHFAFHIDQMFRSVYACAREASRCNCSNIAIELVTERLQVKSPDFISHATRFCRSLQYGKRQMLRPKDKDIKWNVFREGPMWFRVLPLLCLFLLSRASRGQQKAIDVPCDSTLVADSPDWSNWDTFGSGDGCRQSSGVVVGRECRCQEHLE